MDRITQGDVKFYQTDDGGEIDLIVPYEFGAYIDMIPGFESMAYLCLFGGDARDSGSDEDIRRWWGNIGITDKDLMIRSETQFLLNTKAATSSNLLTVQDAAKRDLAVFINKKIADSVEVKASIPTVNKVKLVVDIMARGKLHTFNFTENWIAQYGP